LFSQELKLGIPFGHTAPVDLARFSHDGKWVVTSSWDSQPMLWDVVSGKMIHLFKGHTSRIVSARFTNDDRYLLTASNDKTVKLWNVQTGKVIYTIEGFKNNPESAVLSYNGKLLAISQIYERKIFLYNATTGKLEKTFTGFNGDIREVKFSIDDQQLAVVYTDKPTQVISAVTGKPIFELKGHTGNVNCLVFSPNKKWIATASDNGEAIIWEASSGKLIRDFAKHPASITGIDFSPDNKKMATVSRDGFLTIVETETGKQIKQFNEDGWLLSVNFNKNGNLVLATSNFGHINIYSLVTGELTQTLKKHTNIVSSAVLLDNDEMIVLHWDAKPKIWNIKTGQIIHTIPGFRGEGFLNVIGTKEGNWYVKYADRKKVTVYKRFRQAPAYEIKTNQALGVFPKLSGDDKRFYFNDSNSLRCIELTTGKEVYQSETKEELSPPVFDRQFQQLLTLMGKGFFKTSIVIWNPETGKQLQVIDVKGEVTQAEFSADGSQIFAKCDDTLMKAFDVQTGNEIAQWSASNIKYWSFAVSPDNEHIIIGDDEGVVKVWRTKDQLLIKRWKGHNEKIKKISFNKDGSLYTTASGDNIVKVWKAADGTLLHTLTGHTESVSSASFIKNDKFILTTSEDTQLKLWKSATGELAATFIGVDDGYVTILPNGYYQGDKASVAKLYYVKGMSIVTFDQLDIKYNRPDKVLEALGNTDVALIKSYRQAYEKRIRKLGIDTSFFRDGYSVPSADFVNRNNIQYEQKNDKLVLHIQGSDSIYTLDRFNIWVNEIPVFGQRGINIRHRNNKSIDTTITIKLSQKENRIETSVSNVNGTESYRIPLILNKITAVKQKEIIRFIGIGIDEFADDKYNLQYSTKDIRDLSIKFKTKYKDDIIIDTLFNERVTVSNVKALKQALLKSNENDKVIIAYSGHGMLSKEYDYYLSTYSVNFEKPAQNGLSYDELENLLDSIPARKKLMLIDACHSGEVDKEDLVTLTASSDSLIKGLKPVAYKKEGHLGLKNSFELMQSLFVNVGKSTGATIISAAAGTQFALERNDLKNGVFTYSILEAMNKFTTMKISELKKIVGERVEELTKGLQKPTSRNETIAVDWTLW